ncbi:MAG: NACHT domain-containing protein [Chloroflexi bacterium]|nr:NACHT domain-containing protein [Chloroflexota bacterium]
MSDQLQLSLLGTPQIKLNGICIPKFTLRKSLALLCYLSMTEGEQPRSVLANLLWSESTESNARVGLRKVLTELRRGVGAHLLITRDTVTFDRTSSYWLDVEAFEQSMTQLQGDRFVSFTQEAITALEGAVAYYRGDFLSGLEVYQAPVFEEWMRLQRERLRLQALRMLYILARYHFSQGTFSQAIEYVEQLLGLEPYHEEALRLLMLLLARSGQQFAALRQYQIYHDRLQKELGLMVGKQIATLYEYISNGRISTHSSIQLQPQRLLPPPNPLLGRKRELREVMVLLQDPECRLLTIIGAAGIGKTRLVQEIAAIYASDIIHQETYLVPMVNVQTEDRFIDLIASAVGLYLSQEQHPRQKLLSYLWSRRVLLILDGCEGLIARHQPEQDGLIDLLRDIVNVSPDVKILATSRTRLFFPGECIYYLRGMDYPEHLPEDVESLRNFDAVALFLWQMQRVNPGIEPSPEELQVIARACRLVSGSPLEILLLANRACTLSASPDCDSTCVFYDTRICRENPPSPEE